MPVAKPKRASALEIFQRTLRTSVQQSDPRPAPAAQSAVTLVAPKPAGRSMLDSLMQGDIEEARSAGKLFDIPLADIQGDPNQPRKTIDEHDLANLRATIKAKGLLQVPTVRPHPTQTGKYMVVFGERRVLACRGLFEKIPCRVEQFDEVGARIAQLIENSDRARADVKPWEEAVAFGELRDKLKSQKEICDMTGLPKDYVSKRLSLLDLPDHIKALHTEGLLTDLETSLALKRLYEVEPQSVLQLIRRARKEGRMAREWVQAALRNTASGNRTQGRPNRFQPYAKRVEQLLSASIGPYYSAKAVSGKLGPAIVVRAKDQTSLEQFVAALERVGEGK